MGIQVGKAQTIVATLTLGGQVCALPRSATLTAQLLDNADAALCDPVDLSPDAIGAAWEAGTVVIHFTAEDTADVEPPTVTLLITAVVGDSAQDWRIGYTVPPPRSALFSNPDAAVSLIRSNQIDLAGSIYRALRTVNDDALWLAIRAAEADVARQLTVPLEPTEIFPYEPSQDEITALNGRPYQVEPGYDMPPNFFAPDVWGALKLRVRPVIAISEFKLQYPNQGGATFTVPMEWLRLDKKYGQVQVFPSAQVVTAPLSIFTLQAIGSGRTIPHMIRVRYTAGLSSASEHYPDLVKLVLRAAVLGLLSDSFMPQSGSISADGFSQTTSADLSKFEDAITAKIARLREQILGPIWGVLN